MKLTLLGTTLLLAVSTAIPLQAQRAQRVQRPVTGPATLAIVVSDPTGAPVSAVKVTVDGPAQRSATTEGGRIAFEHLPSGTYHLRFERDGFETLERDVTARGAKPVDVTVTLVPAPKPVPLPPPPPPPAPVEAKAVVIDMPALIEKDYVGRGAEKTTPLACAGGGSATLIQINQPLADQAHADADEFLYVIAGQGSVRLEGREDPLRAGVFVLIPRGVRHTIVPSGRSPLVMLSTRAGDKCGS